MDPSYYSKSWYPLSDGLGSLQPHATDPDVEQYQSFDQYLRDIVSHHAPPNYSFSMLPAQYMTPYDFVGTSPIRGDWNQLPVEHNPFAQDGWIPTGIFSMQPQRANLSYAEKGIQTVQLNPTNESGNRRERPQAHQGPPPRILVHQERYKPTQHHAEFAGPNLIRFIVNGEEGIRLSDVSAGNWEGFEGRDDRSLFEGDRAQILIRLHFAGCSPWHSKVPTTDFTAKRRPITRTRLATEVAKSMKKFIARERLNGHGGGNPRCGWGDVSLENLFLTRMIRVSAASWQPEILVERPPVASTSQATPLPSFASDPIG